jgi:hypothetical protein
MTFMKRSIFGLALAGLLVASPTLAGTVTLNYVFDENGNWSINGSAQQPGALVGGVLTYNLGRGQGFDPIVPGDVLVTEPGSTAISDVLRFSVSNDIFQNAIVQVYSDKGDGVDRKADTGLPSSFFGNKVTMAETGLFGSPYSENGPNGLFGYTPGVFGVGALDPEFPGNFTATYNFISDTPEPASIILAGIGALSMIGYRLRRRTPANV